MHAYVLHMIEYAAFLPAAESPSAVFEIPDTAPYKLMVLAVETDPNK